VRRFARQHGEEADLDDEAIREFLSTTYPRLVAAVALVAGSRDAAEDAVQEALVRAWEHPAAATIESMPAWVTRVSLNLAKSRLRRIRAEAKARQRLGTRVHDAGPDPAKTDIERALRTLPRRQREVTVLRYYLGMNLAEIALVLSVSQGTVKTQLFRARHVLAELLGETEDDEEMEDHAARR
jgi:RNA polymerase sigma-70 factor (ECF subfamily)